MPMCKESLIDFDNYTITEDGRIFSKFYNRYVFGSIQRSGYIRIFLKCTDGKESLFSFHRVIWYYFNGEIPDGMHINHIDECKTNNAFSNLNLMTPKENINWGTGNKRKGEAFKMNGKRSKPVEQFDIATGKIIAVYQSAEEASRQTGFCQSAISRCCNGGYYSKSRGKWVNIAQAYGYGWRYIN